MRGKRRCRLHGGKSTGAKTAAGIHRIRQGSWKDGSRSARLQAECRAAAHREESAYMKFFPGVKITYTAICDGVPDEWETNSEWAIKTGV